MPYLYFRQKTLQKIAPYIFVGTAIALAVLFGFGWLEWFW